MGVRVVLLLLAVRSDDHERTGIFAGGPARHRAAHDRHGVGAVVDERGQHGTGFSVAVDVLDGGDALVSRGGSAIHRLVIKLCTTLEARPVSMSQGGHNKTETIIIKSS